MTDLHTKMMRHALKLAEKAARADEVPVGAVVYTQDGTILGEGYNQTEAKEDPTQHAEFIALRDALSKVKGKHLTDCCLAVTLEPCAMCAQAISYARIKTLYFGASDPKSGGTFNGARIFDHAHHSPEIIDGLLADEAKTLLQDFFQKKRS